MVRVATREAGWQLLQGFLPRAARDYAVNRNFDFGPSDRSNVSTLSPYIRHRLISESEVAEAVLSRHSAAAAEKFIQEVCWRTYWKGWLEQHPQIWSAYLDDVEVARADLRSGAALAAAVAAAECGGTQIACFDAWVHELLNTGYLHNHARMWFASIWIFTLRLPWVLGADFFMRHLLDGDPASNTLSWRWVSGLHTKGKTYLAHPDNIAMYTKDRFSPGPDDFSTFATLPRDTVSANRVALREADTVPDGSQILVVLTEEDLSPETWQLGRSRVCGVVLYRPEHLTFQWSTAVRAFKKEAMADALQRARVRWNVPTAELNAPIDLAAFARTCGADCAVTTWVPVGYSRPDFDAMIRTTAALGYPVRQILRVWDSLLWPHTKAGFFQLRARIPAVLEKLALGTPHIGGPMR